MIWLYEKDSDALRIETRYDNDTFEYVLTVHRAGGHETERYRSLEDFRQRLLAVEKTLVDQRWRRAGEPLFDPEGFPRTRPF